MATAYANYKANLTSSASTTIYTLGSEKTAIIKSIRISNSNVNRTCDITLNLVDANSVVYPLETSREIPKGSSVELLQTGLEANTGENVRSARADRTFSPVSASSPVCNSSTDDPFGISLLVSNG